MRQHTNPTEVGRRRRLFALALTLVLGLTACGSGGGDDDPEETESSAEETESSEPAGEPITLRYAGGNPEDLSQTQMAISWMDSVETCTDGQVTFEQFHGGALVQNTESMPAIRSGQVDLGYTSTAYHVEELPLWEMSGLPFTGNNPVAASLTFAELYETNEIFRQEFEKNDIHMLVFHAVGPAGTYTTQPIETVEDLKGKRLRAVGIIAEAYQAVGTEPVAVGAPEMYESIQRGVIDGVGSLPYDTAPAFALEEVAPYVTDTGLGMYASTGIGMNLDTWNELPDDVKECMTEMGTQAMEKDQPEILVREETESCEAFKAAGGGTSYLTEEDTAEWRAAVREPMVERFIENAAKTTGHPVEQVQTLFDDYIELYEKNVEKSTYKPGMVACAEQS